MILRSLLLSSLVLSIYALKPAILTKDGTVAVTGSNITLSASDSVDCDAGTPRCFPSVTRQVTALSAAIGSASSFYIAQTDSLSSATQALSASTSTRLASLNQTIAALASSTSSLETRVFATNATLIDLIRNISDLATAVGSGSGNLSGRLDSLSVRLFVEVPRFAISAKAGTAFLEPACLLGSVQYAVDLAEMRASTDAVCDVQSLFCWLSSSAR
jgi:hypothetical protein